MSTATRTRSGRSARSRLTHRLHLETLENRCLLANGFLQGIAYVDVNLNDQFDPADTPMPLALIQLFRSGETTPFRETYTGADGYYLFGDVPPGAYRLVEIPPVGYANQSAQGLSQIDPVTVPSGTTNTLEVRLLDPALLSSTFRDHYVSRVIPENGVRLFGEVPIGFQGGDGVAGQIRLTITRPGLPPVDIRTFCAELEVAADWPDGPFTPYPLHGISPPRGLQIGYLFNTYGIRTDLTPNDAAGLQMAIWEMLYDAPSADPWNTGNFQYVITDPAILARGNFYLSDAAGKVGYAAYHNSTDPRFQSFLGTASLNFGNRPLPAMVDAWKWHDLNGDGRWDTNEPGLPGWTIQALRNGQLVASAITMSDDPATIDVNEEGLYWMDLPAGTYTFREVLQDGWRQTYPGGDGTHTITLTPGEQFYAERGQAVLGNFGNFRPGLAAGTVVQLIPDCVGLQNRGGQANVRIVLERQVGTQFQQVAETTTNSRGEFRFANLNAGTYRVRQIVQGWTELSQPPGTFVIFSGREVTDLSFRNQLPPTEPLRCGGVSGQVTHQVPTCDLPENRGGRAGITVFADANRNNQLDAGELRAITDTAGNYRLESLGAGTYRIVAILGSGQRFIGAGSRDAVLAAFDSRVTGIDFRLEVLPPTPLECVPRITDQPRDLLPTFGGTVPALLASQLGGKQQLVASSLLAEQQAGSVRDRTAFVTGLYLHVLGRSPEPAGLTFWVAQFSAGATRAQMIDVFWNSTEHRAIQVEHYYQSYLGRRADPAGRAAWVAGLQAGLPEEELLARILSSPEYATKSAPDDATFAARLYLQLLGRPAETSGHAAWVRALQSGTTRLDMARSFLGSREANRRVVDALYSNFLGRGVDPAGEQTWLGALTTRRLDWEQVAQMILGSQEYFARVSTQARGG